MIKDFEIVIHIGIQRTGTTFLQNNVFPLIDEINIVNIGFRELNFLLEHMNEKNNYITFNKIENRFQHGKINLISNENIWWHPWTGRINKIEKLQKLKLLFPKAKILFGIRNKIDLLLSMYKRNIMDGSTLSYKEFQEKIVNIDDLNYEHYIRNLNDLFYEKNVYIYKFEDMKKDIFMHVKGICNFIDVEVPPFKNYSVNSGYSFWQLKISILLNHLFKTWLNPAGIIPLPYDLLPHKIIFSNKYFPRILRGREFSFYDMHRF